MLITLYPNKLDVQRGDHHLAAAITRAASKQTYYTIRFLMDRDRVQDAYRAYAYFRWLDDQIDTAAGPQTEKLSLIQHQRELLEACYQRTPPSQLRPEEQFLAKLVEGDQEQNSGLQCYLRNMMAVMSYDVQRCGLVISHAELTRYTGLLSKAVTEYMFYFIGHKNDPPNGPARYQAVYGAHIVHMLRDMYDDIAVGYYNFPDELSPEGHVSAEVVQSQPFREWVFERARLAHRYFNVGRKYIIQNKSFRCRLAGLAYLARFEWMLKVIEKEQYCLRLQYPDRKSLRAVLWMAGYVFTSLLNLRRLADSSGAPLTQTGPCEEK
jgi:phytoene/squalene synthetase